MRQEHRHLLALYAVTCAALLWVLAIAWSAGAQNTVTPDPLITGLAIPTCRVMHANTTQAATIADTNETTLWSYTLPANAMRRNRDYVHILAFGTNAANANSKTIRLKFGGTITTIISAAANGGGWRMESHVIRATATTQEAQGFAAMTAGFGFGNIQHTAGAITLTSPVVISMTGQNAVAAANDLVFRGALVELCDGSL
jgi:hypothetical protein